MGIREADLDKHLSNPNGGDVAPVIIKPSESTKPGSPAKPGKDKDKDLKPLTLEPGEIVSKNDFQVNQALNLLKGLQILQAR